MQGKILDFVSNHLYFLHNIFGFHSLISSVGGGVVDCVSEKRRKGYAGVVYFDSAQHKCVAVLQRGQKTEAIAEPGAARRPALASVQNARGVSAGRYAQINYRLNWYSWRFIRKLPAI